MSNIACIGCNVVAAQMSNSDRIRHLCKEEKATFDKAQRVAKYVFTVLCPLLIPGKALYDGLETLNQKVDNLGQGSTSKTIKAITGLFKLAYVIPAIAAALVLKPISGIYDIFYDIFRQQFDYMREGIVKAAKIGDETALKILLESEKIFENLKEDASILAIEHQKLGALKLLVEHKPALQVHVLRRLLEHASEAGWVDGVKMILTQQSYSENDQEFNEKILESIHGGLCCATVKGHHEIVQLLKSHPGITDKHKDIARQRVKYGDVATSVLLLTDNVSEVTHGEYLKLAAEQGLENEVRFLLGKKISPDYKGLALIKAASKGHAGVAQNLLQTKAISPQHKEYAVEAATQAGYIAIANAINQSK